ncbi:TetR/AcrR family transcriptional regulator [Ornithinimicrobium cerasi]|uniref:Transcriptional regulator, TetR family n=1 Tax=Ornithinimicrobium cerasi TaxID=2248773 RepID=A0A285VQQ3_9MICO|nr:TetR/AcrR family transcriptional regulator [Ornithinimicrobium cerasi]SOC55908.1 transcriptional regulator, TetR family [Ornithinimicrobium cerasi]
MTQDVTEAPGRRELNKARTREAIVAALREHVQLRPVDQVTVDQVAESAGISRRTFFNYFAGIQAVISDVIGGYTEQLADAVGDLSEGGSPVQRVRSLLRGVGIPRGLLEWLALLNLHGGGGAGSESLVALERAIWAEKAGWLEGQLRRRLPGDVDDLFVATLAATIMTCFAAAEQSWIADRAPGAPVDDAAVRAFEAQLDRALAYAVSGWATPHPPSSPNA